MDSTYIPRPLYMDRLRPFMETDVVKVLTGLRRSGKSVLLELVREELVKDGIHPKNTLSLNFEDLRNAHLCTADALHAEVLGRAENISGRLYLFFDEIQEVRGWEKCINSLRVSLNCDIYLTGSNAKLLSGELATYLAGRYVELEVFPFSFREYTEAYRSVWPNADRQEAFSAYLRTGGMPYLHALNYAEAPCFQYLRDVFDSVELKDIVKREGVRDVDLLQRIVAYLTANIGTLFSARSIARWLKNEGRPKSLETVLSYVRACCRAFLFEQVKRQDLAGKRLLAVNEKYYVLDHGIREALFGTNMTDIQLILENIVCIEMRRRGYRVSVGVIDGREIDFVGQRGSDVIYVQVAYLLASPETVEREFGVYREIKDNYPKYVVTMDEIDMSRSGIMHRNIRDFLLDPGW